MRARGFSILEAMIAAVVLLIGLAALAQGISSVLRQQEHQRHRAAAATVGGNVMEELIQREDARTLAAGIALTGRYDEKGRAVTGGAYDVVATVVDNDPMEQGRRIDVVVTWRERGLPRVYELRTYAYEPRS